MKKLGSWRVTYAVMVGCLVLAFGCGIIIVDHPCSIDDECSDGLFCNGQEVCADGRCHAGSPPCGTSREGCPDLCNEQERACADLCDSDSDCDDGLFCTGVEMCDECGLCQAGDPPCGSFVEGCPCIEENDACANCCNDADCDDGVFCNGEEICVNFSCSAGAPPCGPPQEECDFCHENLQACVSPCTSDADCDDGVFCNGAEFCDEENCGVCARGGSPCEGDVSDGCPDMLCDEDNDGCVVCSFCREEADCPDDGLFCNGAESCDTVSCCCFSSGSPCGDQPCDEATRSCLPP